MVEKNDDPSPQTNLSRACVFIDSSNPSMPYQVIDTKIRPLIKIPFPPVIDPINLIAQQSNANNAPTRAPNAFIIYRKAFTDAAHAGGYHLPMRIMSSMASQSWEQESDIVKSEYRRLANEAFNLRNEMYPKSGCKRKRAKWNIVSFKNKNKTTKKRQKWNIVSFDPKKPNSSNPLQNKTNDTKESIQIQQIPSPVQSSSISQNESNKEDCFSTLNNIFPSPEMNFDISINVNANNTFNEDFTYQNIIPSPELSITSSLSPELTEQIDYDLDFCYPEQSLNGIFNQTQEEQINFQQIKNSNPFNYYQTPEFNNNSTFVCNNNNECLLNENISSQQGYFNNGSIINFQSTDALFLYNNVNYSSSGLGISSSSLSGVEYFQNSVM